MASPPLHLNAMLAALGAYAIWVLCDTSNKLAAQAGLPFGEIIGILNVSGLITIFVAAAAMGQAAKLRPKKWGAVLLGCGLAAAGTISNVIALKYLPLTVFYICVFSNPLVTALLAAVLIGEKLGVVKILAIVTGFAGVVVAIVPSYVAPSSDGANLEIIGYATVLVGVICAAFAWIILRRVTQSESLWSINAVFYIVMISAGALFLPLELNDVVLPDWPMVLLLVGAGVISVAARFLITYAVRHTTAANVTQANYSQILWAAAIAYLIWGEVPGPSLVVGAVLIIGAGLVIAREAHRLDQRGGTTDKPCGSRLKP